MGARLAVEQANGKGLPGGYKLEVDALDDSVQGLHNVQQGAQNVSTFVSDPAVLAIVGPFNSNVAKAQIPLTNAAGLAQIDVAATNPALTIGPDAAKLRTKNPGTIAFFRVCATDDRQGQAGADFAKRLKFKKMFIVDDNETYGLGLANIFETDYQAGGGTVLGHEHITKGQQDFKALLTKIAATHPDAVFFGGVTASGGGLLRKQMGDVGLGKTAFFGGDGISDADFVKVTGKLADGTYYTVAAPEATKLPSAASFLAAYKKKYDQPIGAYSANGYAAAQVAIAAIAKAIGSANGAEPTRAAVLANIASSAVQTPIGLVKFNANGDTASPIISLYEIKGGKQTFVRQLNLKL